MAGSAVLGVAVLTALAGPATAGGARPAHASAKARPKIAITLSPHARVGHDAALSARVRVSGSSGAAKGEVDIVGLPTGDCHALTLVHGRTSCESYALHVPIGTHTVTVRFHGDKHYRSGTADASVQVTRARTELDLDTSPESPAPAASKVELTAQLVDIGGYSPASGTVRFSDADGTFTGCGRVTIDHDGFARCTTTLSAGSYTITSAFTGAKNFRPTRSSLKYTVDKGAVQVATSTLPDGLVGSAYSTTLAASGGTGPYTWEILHGGLPTGLTLSRTGVISGTPSAPGKWSVTIETTDANGTSSLRAFTLRITTPVNTTR